MDLIAKTVLSLSASGRVMLLALKKFFHDDCLTLSTSISYVFLLSLIPFAALNVFLFKQLLGLMSSDPAWDAQVISVLTDEVNNVLPFVSPDWVRTYVINPKAYKSFSIFNFLLLPLVSGLIFQTLETTYRKIFKLPIRNLLLSQLLYAVVTVFIVLFLFIFNFTWSILAASRSFNEIVVVEYVKQISTSVLHINPHLHLLSLVVLVLFFIVTTKTFLHRVHVPLRYCLIGGAVFAGLWIAARALFGLYMQHIAGLNVLYGSLSSIVIVLLWVFWSAITLLYALEIVHILHFGEHRVTPAKSAS
jgi:membrane protein